MVIERVIKKMLKVWRDAFSGLQFVASLYLFQ